MDATGNPNMSECAKMTRKAHILIGKKANLGTGEEDFNMKKGFIKSEPEEGLEEAPPPLPRGLTASGGSSTTVAGGSLATIAGGASTVLGDGASMILAGEALTILSLVECTPTPKKRSYQQQKKSSVPADAAAFNEYIRSQQQRAKWVLGESSWYCCFHVQSVTMQPNQEPLSSLPFLWSTGWSTSTPSSRYQQQTSLYWG